MLLTNLKLDKQTDTPLYTQIIDSIKNQLYNDQIAAGDRLPSVRRLSAALQISRTTVEKRLQSAGCRRLSAKRT